MRKIILAVLIMVLTLTLAVTTTPLTKITGKTTHKKIAKDNPCSSGSGTCEDWWTQKASLHEELVPVPETPKLASQGIGRDYRYQEGIHFIAINFYFNPQLSVNGNMLNKNDSVCRGDQLMIDNRQIEGEWFGKGGPWDTPPVVWTDDLDKVIKEINEGVYETDTEWSEICCYYTDLREKEKCVLKAAVVCEQDCNMEVGGDIKQSSQGQNIYEALGAGEINIETKCEIECILFVERPEGAFEYNKWSYPYSKAKAPALYGYMSLKDPPYLSMEEASTFPDKVMHLEDVYTLEVEDAVRIHSSQLSVEITQLNEVEGSLPVTVRFEVTNSEDIELNLRDVSLSVPAYSIVYAPQQIEPHKSSEVIVDIIDIDSPEITAYFDFSTTVLACKDSKSFIKEIKISGAEISGVTYCNNDADCPANFVCCVGTCKDTSKGTCDDIDGDASLEWVYY